MARNKSYFHRKRLFAILASLLVLTGVVFYLEKADIINLYSKQGTTEQNDQDAKTTSTAETAQEDFIDGDDRQPGSSLGEGRGSGSISDNNGAVPSGVETSNPIVSSSGEISVYTPKSSAEITSGQTVAGASSLSKISYRLIDNVSGVIAYGELSVVNGKFSGSLSFDTSANEGRLDIYGVKADGSEFSNIEIPVRFD